jgi:hypothetical protein
VFETVVFETTVFEAIVLEALVFERRQEERRKEIVGHLVDQAIALRRFRNMSMCK